MSLSLKAQKVLITGSTDGLGKKLAASLLEAGAEVIIHGRSQAKVDATLAELHKLGQVTGIVCDLNQPEALAASFSQINELDILINNAGVWLEGSTVDANPAKIHELVHVGLLTPLVLTRLLLPVLQKSKFAQIINVSSVAGVEIPHGYSHTFYSAVKYGLQGFSEALAKEFDGKQLRVMGYYPGGMETKFFAKAGNSYKAHEPWMFDPQESAEALIFMLTRNPKVSAKRVDLVNQLWD